MRDAAFFCALGLIALTPACGSLDANTGTAPTLASLQGTLENPQSIHVAASDPVRVAVVWRNSTPGSFDVAEDLPLQPVFPASFTIALGAPPPAAAMMTGAKDAGPSGSFAYGTVVAYVDQNHDGKLDLVDSGAASFVDRIIATSGDAAILYVQGDIHQPGKTSPSQGYSLIELATCDTPTPASSNPACTSPSPATIDAGVMGDAGSCGSPQFFSIDHPLVLTISNSPRIATLMCADLPGSSATGAGAPLNGPSEQPSVYPDPCNPSLSCAADGSSYYYESCMTTSQGLCGTTMTNCTSVGYSRPTPVPTGWPCTR